MQTQTIIYVPTDFELEPSLPLFVEKPKEVHLALTPGEVVRLFPTNRLHHHEFYGLVSRPVLVLKRLGPKLTLVAPVVDTPHRSAYYPPFVLSGHPCYLSIPNIRVIHNARIQSVYHSGKVSPHTLSRLLARVRQLLTAEPVDS